MLVGHVVLGASLLVGLAAGPVLALPGAVLGDSFLVKDTGSPQARKLLVKAKEKASDDTPVPVFSTGVTLTITVNGGTAGTQTQTFNLSAGPAPSGKQFWSGDLERGFTYSDPTGAQGAIKTVKMKKTANGIFQIRILASGKFAPLSLVPPDPGTDACVLLKMGISDVYFSVKFGPSDGIIKNAGARSYSHGKPTSEGSCLPPD
jgi:hypothetical protein